MTGIEYRVHMATFEELETKLNELAGEGWRYVDFVFEASVDRQFEPGVMRFGVLIMERTVGEARK